MEKPSVKHNDVIYYGGRMWLVHMAENDAKIMQPDGETKCRVCLLGRARPSSEAISAFGHQDWRTMDAFNKRVRTVSYSTLAALVDVVDGAMILFNTDHLAKLTSLHRLGQFDTTLLEVEGGERILVEGRLSNDS